MTHTNTTKKAAGASNTNGLHTDANSADFRSHGAIKQAYGGKIFVARVKAVYARIKDLVSGFYLDRGVGIEAVATLILVAVFTTVMVMQ